MNRFEYLILKSASEIVKFLKKSLDEPSGSQKSKSFLNELTTHISESEYMLYTCIMKPRIYARKRYPTGLGYGQLTNETLVCKILDPSILTKCECFCLIRGRPK